MPEQSLVTSRTDTPETWPAASDADSGYSANELARLRELLFGAELGELEALKKRLDDPSVHARELSVVLADALLLRTGRDDKLGKALEPVVEEIVKGALRKSPMDFISVLFPLMGPSIRRSIAETFHSMLQSLHKTLEMSFSWRGLNWRLEALRTGQSFSEVVLLHTLIYRVDQIFLIHSNTGLVLAHLHNEGVEGQDADMVSAMLTAIQDFARDCFNSANKEELNSLQMGDATIFVERSAKAYLACVVRGMPPQDFIVKLRSALELIVIEFADALDAFDGDAAPFALVHRYLDDFLITRVIEDNKPLPLWVKALPLLVLLGLGAIFGLWSYHEANLEEVRAREYERLQRGVAALNREPGIILYNVQRSPDNLWTLFFMRDELARSTEAILAEHMLLPEDFAIQSVPFVSYEASIVTQRVANAISPPETVRVYFEPEQGLLRLVGTAPMDWILQSRQTLLAMPGIKQLDFHELEDPRTSELYALVNEVEAISVEFPLGKDMPVPADQAKLIKAVDQLVRLEKLAEDMGVSVAVTVYGHADTVGLEKRNYELSLERAKTLAAMLYARGSAIPLTTYGMGAQYADAGQKNREGHQASRRIELKVHLAQMPRASVDLFGEKKAQ